MHRSPQGRARVPGASGAHRTSVHVLPRASPVHGGSARGACASVLARLMAAGCNLGTAACESSEIPMHLKHNSTPIMARRLIERGGF